MDNEQPSQALAVRTAMPLQQTLRVAEVLAQSGYFTNTRTAAQAAAKILAGQELGIAPMAAMQNIYVIDGKTSFSATLIATLIQNSGRFSYRVRRKDAQAAEIEFFERGESLGVESFTLPEATAAGLTAKDNWRKYPKAMLFSRALSNGAKTYCPAVFAGQAIYTPDELDPDLPVDPATGEVLGTAYEVETGPAPATDDQKRAITRAFGQLHWNGPARERWLADVFDGVAGVSELTEAQATEVLIRLRELLEPAGAAPVAEAS